MSPLQAPDQRFLRQCALAGNVYVTYQDGTDASANVSGQVTNAVSGEEAELYARQFPSTSPPTLIDSVALDPSGMTAQADSIG